MCYDDADGTAGRQEAGPESPSRRAFSRLLLAGTGLAALSACTPAQSFTPSGTPGPTPGTGMAVRRRPQPPRRRPRRPAHRRRPPAARGGGVGPAVGRGAPSLGRGAGAAAFTLGPHQSLGDRQQAPAALPRHLCAAGPGPAGRPPGHLRRGGAAEQHDGGRGGEDVRGRGRRRRHHHPGQRVPFVRDADGDLRQLRDRAQGQAGGRHRLRPAGLFRAPDGLGVRHWRRQRRGRFHAPVQGPAGGDLGQGERPPLRLRGPLPVDAARNHRLFLRAMASALHRYRGGHGHVRPRDRHAGTVLRSGAAPAYL